MPGRLWPWEMSSRAVLGLLFSDSLIISFGVTVGAVEAVSVIADGAMVIDFDILDVLGWKRFP
jgi:hypothetical protein